MVYLLFFFAFMPYISLGLKFPTNVQPYFFMMGWAIAFVKGWQANGRIAVSFDLKLLFFISVFLIVYINPIAGFDYYQWLRKSGSILFIFGAVLVISNAGLSKANIPLIFSLILYSIFSALHYLYPQIFLDLAGFFVVIRDVELGIRGTPSLAPEATDFGFTMVYLLLVAILMKHHKLISNRFSFICFLLCGLNILLSLSISGFMAVICLLLVWVMKNHLLRLLMVALILAGSGYLVGTIVSLSDGGDLESNFRVIKVLSYAISDPSTILSTSFAHRFVHLYVGFLGMIDTYGLGFGAASFTLHAADLFNEYNLALKLNLNHYYSTAVVETLKTSPVSMIGMLMFEYGIFGMLICIYLITIPIFARLPYGLYLSVMIFLSLFQSFPLSYPPMWIVISYIIYEKKQLSNLKYNGVKSSS